MIQRPTGNQDNLGRRATATGLLATGQEEGKELEGTIMEDFKVVMGLEER